MLRSMLFVALLTVLASSATSQPSQFDLLNFALQLEYLEAQYYTCAVTGKPLTAAQTGPGAGTLTGCQQAALDPTTMQIANELMILETTHVQDLRGILGSAAVPQPDIDIGIVFSNAANAAAGMNLTPAFSPYNDSLSFLEGAFFFEPVGATAYLGAAPLLASNATLLTYAAGIYGVEAYHSGIVGSFLYMNVTTQQANGANPATFTQNLATLENRATGELQAQGITATLAGQQDANLVPVNATGMLFARTPQEVLSIVTLGSSTGAGGFFPKGLNGYFGPSALAPSAG